MSEVKFIALTVFVTSLLLGLSFGTAVAINKPVALNVEEQVAPASDQGKVQTSSVALDAPAEVWVDAGWNSQADVNLFNPALIYGYDAFKIIQEGINAVGGSTVHVRAGIYVENLMVNKSIALSGAGADFVTVYPTLSAPDPDPGGGSSLPPGASNLILVQANNVIISGFTLNGDNPALFSGIVVGGADLDARNGIITNHNAGVYTNLEVHDVVVKNIYLRGIYASSGGTFNFHHNTVQNVNAENASIAMFNHSGSGIMAYNTVTGCNDAISSNYSKGVQFLNNVITNCNSGVHTDNAGYGSGTADLIFGNQISNSPIHGYGIFVFAPYIAPVVQENTITNVDVGLTCAGTYSVTPLTIQFKNNTVNGTGKANSVGIYVTTEIWGYASGNVWAEFTDNFITNNIDGSYIVAEAGFTSSLKCFDNDFGGNTNSNYYAGIGSMGAGTFNVDLSGNWWGSSAPETVKSLIVGNADYTPWLNIGTNTSSPGFYGDFSALWVDDDSPQSGTVNRVQEAVNMVTGSTIYLASGLYTGQVVVDGFADLNIIGSGITSTTIQATASMPHYFSTSASNYAIISVENSGTVNVSDLTVDGLGFGNSNYRFVGIAYFNSGGTVNSCRVQDVRDTPISGLQHGIGIYAYNNIAPSHTVNVTQTTVIGFQKGGITLNGAYTTGDVSFCNAIGYGPASFIAMNGIQIGFGASGRIVYSNVNACSYTGAGATAAGIILYQNAPGVRLTQNITTDCQVGISLTDGGAVIDSNTTNTTSTGPGVTTYWGILGMYSAAGRSIGVAASPFTELTSQFKTEPAIFTTTASDNILIGRNDPSSVGIEPYVYGIGNLTFAADHNNVSGFGTGMGLYIEPGATLSSDLQSNNLHGNILGLENVGGTVNALHNNFANTTNASDDHVGNTYTKNCWSDYNGTPPYAIGGGGGNFDNNPSQHCGNELCGDADGSSNVDIADVVYLIAYIFSGGPAPSPLLAGDANCDGAVDIADAVYLIAYIFSGGPEPCAACK
jgi:hypothetical protein